MKKLVVLFFLILGMLKSQPCNIPNSSVYAFTVNGKSYEIVKVNMTWTAAAACAVSKGGKLAEVMSKQENDSLYHYAKNKAGIITASTTAPDGGGASYVWIGGNDIQNEGKWIWDGDGNLSGPQFWQGDFSGNPVGGYYNAWGSVNGGEPDDYLDQDGLGLALTPWPFGNAGEWNDINTNNQLYFIIEYTNPLSLPNKPSSGSFDLKVIHDVNAWIILHDRNTVKIGVFSLEGKLIKEYSNPLGKDLTKIPYVDLGFKEGMYLLRTAFSDGSVKMNRVLLKN